MDDTGTRSGATEEEKQNFDRFLNMLTAAFSGRRCILYEHKTMIPSGSSPSASRFTSCSLAAITPFGDTAAVVMLIQNRRYSRLFH